MTPCYRDLYNELIGNKIPAVIIDFKSHNKTFTYLPFSHYSSDTALDDLYDLLIDNTVFYTFSEKELLSLHEDIGLLDDLRDAAKYSFSQFLPKRTNPNTDGTIGEVLLDLLIQGYQPDAQKLIARAKFTEMDKKSEIVGPIDVSFWLGYRFKVKSDSEFCLRFTGEPYNRDYYPELWQNYGFEVSDIYFSNRIRRINPADVDKKCVKRFEQSIEKGYEYRNLDMKQFDRQLDEVYELFIELYSSFPGFTHISKEQFHGLFKNMKLIIRPEMAKFVYKDGKLVGFFICIPNFYNLTTQISLVNILKILRIKKKPKEYVLLYMGVKPEALGLGAALAEVVRRQLEIMGVESIGALIHQGKVTGNYYKKCIIDKYEYVLLKKQV